MACAVPHLSYATNILKGAMDPCTAAAKGVVAGDENVVDAAGGGFRGFLVALMRSVAVKRVSASPMARFLLFADGYGMIDPACTQERHPLPSPGARSARGKQFCAQRGQGGGL